MGLSVSPTAHRVLAPGPGIWAANLNLQMVSTFGIFVLSGLSLRRSQAAQALKSWGAVLYGFAFILLITPLAGFLALRLPLQPPELAFGLAVFCCVPCTLSSGVSLTQVLALQCSRISVATQVTAVTWPSGGLSERKKLFPHRLADLCPKVTCIKCICNMYRYCAHVPSVVSFVGAS